MLLAEPPRTAWDLRFSLTGIPVRVSPLFWLASVVLGWNFAQDFSQASAGELTVGVGLLIWTAAVFISILVHEFGHAFAFRYFGLEADVVLYHFGGLAIPRQAIAFGSRAWQDPKRQIIISAAGPAAQILLAIFVAAVLYVGGYRVPNPLPFITQLDFLETGDLLPSISLVALEYALIISSVYWALLNLLPVYPLDGGQIAREIFTIFNPREGIRYSLILSIATGMAAAVWGLTNQDTFLAIMFGLLAYSSYMTLQVYLGRGGGFGGGRW